MMASISGKGACFSDWSEERKEHWTATVMMAMMTGEMSFRGWDEKGVNCDGE